MTGFFRDPEAWQVLDQRVIAPLVQERPAKSSIRIWVPGCSTGEEAYSIAMLIAERAEAARKQFDLKFFATDFTQGALGAARAGIYPASIAQDVMPRRLERSFEMEDDTYCVSKALRETITFCAAEPAAGSAVLEDAKEGRRVRLGWEESGGPEIDKPGGKGFGTRLIERACTHELDGEVELEYVPSGLRCEVVFPLS